MNTKRVAIVTGSSRGIGRATILKLASLDYCVVISYKESWAAADSLALELRRAGVDCLVCKMDVNIETEVRALFDQTLEKWGQIDLLVNNAGITEDALFPKMTLSSWQRVISTDLTGIFNCCRVCVAHMVERSCGKIINISSFIALKGGIGQTNYAAAKAGIIGFSKSLALELARYGITVNVIAPGYIETDMMKSIPERLRAKFLAQIPLRRFGEPEDVAEAVAYLANNSGDYITGQVLSVNGGIYM